MRIAAASASRAGGGVVEIEQDAHADLARDERIVIVTLRLGPVVGQQAAADVGADFRAGFDGLQQPQPGDGEWHVELDPERGRGQDQGADRRGEIMHPGRGDHRTHAVRHQGKIFERQSVGLAQVTRERFEVADVNRDGFRIAALAG